MRKGFDRRVRSLGLTRPQWRVLVYVLENEGLSQSMLARAMDLERAPLGQLVRALENLRLVRRVRSSADQREWLIYGGEDSARHHAPTRRGGRLAAGRLFPGG
ncbi:MarR family winged helix-turn-helix transcriptional regulator [Phenylobacterium sp. J426]|uniref:MarR family winged helix-turn-helix transcriptional regulator n=1 Tax=Phenylobacterium sp. J426 TaxID=2898439 RepID=UPI0035ADBAFA